MSVSFEIKKSPLAAYTSSLMKSMVQENNIDPPDIVNAKENKMRPDNNYIVPDPHEVLKILSSSPRFWKGNTRPQTKIIQNDRNGKTINLVHNPPLGNPSAWFSEMPMGNHNIEKYTKIGISDLRKDEVTSTKTSNSILRRTDLDSNCSVHSASCLQV